MLSETFILTGSLTDSPRLFGTFKDYLSLFAESCDIFSNWKWRPSSRFPYKSDEILWDSLQMLTNTDPAPLIFLLATLGTLQDLLLFCQNWLPSAIFCKILLGFSTILRIGPGNEKQNKRKRPEIWQRIGGCQWLDWVYRSLQMSPLWWNFWKFPPDFVLHSLPLSSPPPPASFSFFLF